MNSRVGYCIFLLQLSVSVFGYTSIDYIDDNCGLTISVDEAVRINLLSSSWPSSSTCTVTLQGSSFYHSDSFSRILLRFRSLSLSCSDGYVDILDSDGTTKTSGSRKCGYSLPFIKSWASTGNTIKIRLTKLSPLTNFNSGSFEILATQFTSGVCAFSEFACSNGRCIDDSLTCDGYNNCGDNSDEWTSSCDYTGWSTSLTGGVAFGGIFFFVFFVVLIAGIYRRRTYGYYWRSGVPYNKGISTISTSTTTVGCRSAVSTPQYGVQTPAPVYTSTTCPAPPPPYPYSQTQYPGACHQ